MLFFFSMGYRRLSIFPSSENINESKFSILIPFRNEGEQLPGLLQSLDQLDYPKKNFEVWMINDESSDNSLEAIHTFTSDNPNLQIRIIDNNRKTNSAKKDAILSGIELSNFNWIITTDADCRVPENWLKLYDQAIKTYEPVLLAAPVGYTNIKNTVLDQIQFFEFLSLQIITIGAFGLGKPFMCNGANLCYHKTTFLSLNGFEGNEDFAGGDDLFLMEKMLEQYPKSVHFIKHKDCMVNTKTENSWNAFFSQRIRWAAKSGGYKKRIGKLTGLIVFFGNLTLVVLLLSAFFYPQIWAFALLSIIIKILADLSLIVNGKVLFNRPIVPLFFLVSSLIYPFLNVYIGFQSFFGFTWKERRYQK
ncbi:glycosyltransferase family 2 protein [Namhaeicola litoreus]|uniref:Glycosyltransferase n=1 Tax=Namhaeicola litoreus TaxID=1052145 RepID=A0ABW3Y0K0_9FLAO